MSINNCCKISIKWHRVQKKQQNKTKQNKKQNTDRRHRTQKMQTYILCKMIQKKFVALLSFDMLNAIETTKI